MDINLDVFNWVEVFSVPHLLSMSDARGEITGLAKGQTENSIRGEEGNVENKKDYLQLLRAKIYRLNDNNC